MTDVNLSYLLLGQWQSKSFDVRHPLRVAVHAEALVAQQRHMRFYRGEFIPRARQHVIARQFQQLIDCVIDDGWVLLHRTVSTQPVEVADVAAWALATLFHETRAAGQGDVLQQSGHKIIVFEFMG